MKSRHERVAPVYVYRAGRRGGVLEFVQRTVNLRGPGALGGLLLLVFGVYLAYLFAAEVRETRQLREEILRVEREIQAIHARNQELQEVVSQLRDPAYLERVAREELGMVRPGETRYVVQEEKPGE